MIMYYLRSRQTDAKDGILEYHEEMNLPMPRNREPLASIEEEMMLIRMPEGK